MILCIEIQSLLQTYSYHHQASQQQVSDFLFQPQQALQKVGIWPSGSAPRTNPVLFRLDSTFLLGGATPGLCQGSKGGAPSLRLAWHCPRHRARTFRKLYALNPPALHAPVRGHSCRLRLLLARNISMSGTRKLSL